MSSGKKVLLMISVLSFLMIIFLFGTKSYFNHQIITLANDRCYEVGGTPVVEKDMWAINYSFSCEEAN